MTLPDVLGIGAMRCGTTWLSKVLDSHPDVYLPGRRKEVHFFDRYYSRGLEWYAGFFEGAKNEQVLCEFTPNYLFDADVPERVRSDVSDARFIVILRDPVDRAYSQYRYGNNAVRGDSFDDVFSTDAVLYKKGLYAEQLRRWFDVFDRDRFLILILEEVSDDLDALRSSLGDFLDVDPANFDVDVEGANASFTPARLGSLYVWMDWLSQWLRRHDLDVVVNAGQRLGVESLLRVLVGSVGDDGLSQEQERRLYRLYEDDIEELEALLDRDLSVWKRSY